MIKVIERKTVRHRDGSSTEYIKNQVTIDEVIRRFAIWVRMLPVMTYEIPSNVRYEIIKEKHGMLTYTRLRITNTSTGRTEIATKTDLGKYFGVAIESLDENGAVFWENTSLPNYWVLADTFAV